MAASKTFTTRITKQRRVRDRLFNHITSPLCAPGERLASMKRLAMQFNTSIRTVQQAVTDLEAEGYVDARPGSGTFVTSRHKPLTMADAVVLCMQGHGHVWADLAGLFMDALSVHGKLAMLWDLSSPEAQYHLAKRLAHAEAQTLIVSPFHGFPYDVFDFPGFQSKTVIAVLRWSGTVWPGLYRVLTDGVAGGRLVADHLWAAGHRRILVVGTAEEVAELTAEDVRESVPGPALVRNWVERGGAWQSLASAVPEPVATFDEARFAALFKDPVTAPTAVVGLRDMEAWSAQWLLSRIRPDWTKRVEIVGYYDTPWSLAGRPPFSTVSLDPEQIVAESVGIMRAVAEGDPPKSTLVRVSPRLVLR